MEGSYKQAASQLALALCSLLSSELVFCYSSWRWEVAGETGCLLVVSCCFSSVIWLKEGMIHLNLSQLLIDLEDPQQIIEQGNIFSKAALLFYRITVFQKYF